MEVTKTFRISIEMTDVEAKRVANLLDQSVEESESRDEIEFVREVTKKIREALNPRRRPKRSPQEDEEDYDFEADDD